MARDRDNIISVQLLTAADELWLDDFLEELKTLRAALRETERVVTANEPTLSFLVKRLEKNSPATVVLEATHRGHGATAPPEPLRPSLASYVVRSFTTNLRVITKRKKRPRSMDVAALRAYRKLAQGLEQKGLTVQIETDGRSAVVDRAFRQAIDSVMGPDETSYGSISGLVEVMNVHNDRNRFWVFPLIGPDRIRGVFSAKDRERFIPAMGKYATLWGTLKYKAWDDNPYEISADDICIHDEAKAPQLGVLRGAAPDATGDLTTQEFLDLSEY